MNPVIKTLDVDDAVSLDGLDFRIVRFTDFKKVSTYSDPAQLTQRPAGIVVVADGKELGDPASIIVKGPAKVTLGPGPWIIDDLRFCVGDDMVAVALQPGRWTVGHFFGDVELVEGRVVDCYIDPQPPA